jgi:hypothetical protein
MENTAPRETVRVVITHASPVRRNDSFVERIGDTAFFPNPAEVARHYSLARFNLDALVCVCDLDTQQTLARYFNGSDQNAVPCGC